MITELYCIRDRNLLLRTVTRSSDSHEENALSFLANFHDIIMDWTSDASYIWQIGILINPVGRKFHKRVDSFCQISNMSPELPDKKF